MKSIVAALFALLILPASALAETPTGGFSSDASVAEAPVGRAAIASDRRTAVAPQGAPAEVVKAIAAANKITRKPYQWGGGHAYMEIAGLRFDTSGAGEDGPRWRLEKRSARGFVKRHPAGL